MLAAPGQYPQPDEKAPNQHEGCLQLGYNDFDVNAQQTFGKVGVMYHPDAGARNIRPAGRREAHQRLQFVRLSLQMSSRKKQGLANER
jgi:hypothetical protein